MIDKLTGRALDKTGIRDRLSALDGVEFVCVGIVAVGLFGESFSVPHAGDVVTLGVLGEFILHWFHVRASKRSEEIADEEAEAARGAIADANARAAEANEKAEHERVERLKIEAKLAPRRLSAGQIDSISSKLSGIAEFLSARVPVFRSNDEAEIAALAEDIAQALTQAKWNTRVATRTEHERIPVGVLVEVSPDRDGQYWAFAAMLAQALREQGIRVDGPQLMERRGFRARFVSDADISAPIHVIVGEKP